jgi:hypothetical protein
MFLYITKIMTDVSLRGEQKARCVANICFIDVVIPRHIEQGLCVQGTNKAGMKGEETIAAAEIEAGQLV